MLGEGAPISRSRKKSAQKNTAGKQARLVVTFCCLKGILRGGVKFVKHLYGKIFMGIKFCPQNGAIAAMMKG